MSSPPSCKSMSTPTECANSHGPYISGRYANFVGMPLAQHFHHVFFFSSRFSCFPFFFSFSFLPFLFKIVFTSVGFYPTCPSFSCLRASFLMFFMFFHFYVFFVVCFSPSELGQWYHLILDEAQNIKNFKSQRWQTLLTFNSRRRLLLTGTPLQNSLMELWSLMHFLMPHVFRR